MLAQDAGHCDARHASRFTSDGGTIRHLATGQDMRFHWVEKVYRLKARAQGADSESPPGASPLSCVEEDGLCDGGAQKDERR